VVCWGTGRPTREFLYVEDAATAIVMAGEKYNGQEPVNIGNGQEITIKELSEVVARLVGFKGTIRWDASKSDGQPRRCLDVSKAKNLFGFSARVGLEQGLRETIAWYEKSAAGSRVDELIQRS
jgi:GDP-L-fucose synthase